MSLEGRRVVITSAGRDFGRSLAIELADHGAEVFLSARTASAAAATVEAIRQRGSQRAHGFVCDLSEPASISRFAGHVGQLSDRVDVLINNGAPYLQGEDLLSADDTDISATVAAGATGTILAVKHFLPLLRQSNTPDIVTMVSTAGVAGDHVSAAHPAFYAAKHAQAGFSRVMSHRLRPEGIRVMALYPPDFDNPDRLSAEWNDMPRKAESALTAQSLIDCVLFAIRQPRDCFLSSLHFEMVRPAP